MSRFRHPLSQLVFAALALFLLWLALRSVSLVAVWQILRQLQPIEILVLVLVNGLILLTLSARWWILLRTLGYSIPPLKLLGYRLSAFSVSYFTPGPHFGGEPVQVYTVAKWHDVPYPAAIAAVTMDKLLEMLINFSFLAAGVLIVVRQQVLASWLERQLLLYALILLVIPIGLLTAMWIGRHPISRLLQTLSALWIWLYRRTKPALSHNSPLPRWIVTVRNSEDQVIWLSRHHPRALLLAICISILSWVGMIGEFWLMTWMLGLSLSPIQAITALVAARVAILLPMPGGLGALEFSQTFAMSSLGLPPAAGISMVVLIRSRDLILSLIGLWNGGLQIWRHSTPPPTDDLLPMADSSTERQSALPQQVASTPTQDDSALSYDAS